MTENRSGFFPKSEVIRAFGDNIIFQRGIRSIGMTSALLNSQVGIELLIQAVRGLEFGRFREDSIIFQRYVPDKKGGLTLKSCKLGDLCPDGRSVGIISAVLNLQGLVVLSQMHRIKPYLDGIARSEVTIDGL